MGRLIYAGDSLYIMLESIYNGMKPYVHLGNESKVYDNSQMLLARTLFNFPNQKLLQKRIVQTQKKQKVGKLDPDNIHEPRPQEMLFPLDYKKKHELEQASKVLEQDLVTQQAAPQNEEIIKREVNVSLEHKSAWELSIFTEFISDENLVCFGDIRRSHSV